MRKRNPFIDNKARAPRYMPLSWAWMKARNNYALTKEEKKLIAPLLKS